MERWADNVYFKSTNTVGNAEYTIHSQSEALLQSKLNYLSVKKIKSSNVNLVNSRFVFLIHVHEFEALLESNFFSQKWLIFPNNIQFKVSRPFDKSEKAASPYMYIMG